MKQQTVYFILPPRTLLLDVAGPAEALWMANRYQKDVRFQLRFAGPEARVQSSIGLTLDGIGPLPTSPGPNDMIVVAGAADAPARAAPDPGRIAITRWLRRVARPTRRLVFICSGALLAAGAGILDHRACTTHHTDCDELRRLALV